MSQEASRKTVFVIGAGASVDFGFPVGSVLATTIRNKLDREFMETTGVEDKGPLRTALDEIGFTEGHLDAARQLRAGLMGESIDRFLFRRRRSPIVRDLGLMAVADVILECERHSNLNKFDLRDFEGSLNTLRVTANSWPSVLLEHIIGDRGPEEITPELFSGISFVIFNYDRCVEQVLFHHLHRRHHLSGAEALSIMRSIPMLHVYGVLGDAFEGDAPFGASSRNLASIAGRLQTYYEDFSDAERQSQINELIRPASEVCFLGFGFLSQNLERLFPPTTSMSDKRLSGTKIGCQGNPTFETAIRTYRSNFADGNCTEFLRNHANEILFAQPEKAF